MPRIRTIKPEFWSSPDVIGADPWVRLLYIAMWNWADDTGRGTANVKELAAFAFPHDDDPGAPTAAELPSLLTEIRGRFGVVFYTVAGRRYYAIPSWSRHQRNERKAQPRHPGPDDGIEYDPSANDQQGSEQPQQSTGVPPPSYGSSDATHGSSGPGTGEQRNRGSKEAPPAVAPPPSDPEPENKITAGTVVAGWAEAFEESTGRKPSGSMRGQVGREAKACLETADASLVLKAATQVAGKGFATLERELAPMLAKAKATPVIPDGWPEGWGAPSVPGSTNNVPFWER